MDIIRIKINIPFAIGVFVMLNDYRRQILIWDIAPFSRIVDVKVHSFGLIN